MKHVALHTSLATRLSALSVQISASCAQGLTDLPKHAEDLIAGLLHEFLGYRHIRNLNATERRNFPGLDLADDEKRTGFQVTASNDLEKIKSTLETAKKHGLLTKYPNVKIFILTKKQSTYSQSAIDKVLGDAKGFSATKDILDIQDLLLAATSASPISLAKAHALLDAYEHGAVAGLVSADFDPPSGVTESVELNLLQLYFPSKIFIADLLSRPKTRSDGRKHLRDSASQLGNRVPSDFEVFEGKLVTFYDLEASANPFAGLYDRGTTTTLQSKSFAAIDENYERVFKSLLRFTLQQQMYKQRVFWRHEEKIFVFMPMTDEQLVRKEQWTDKRSDTRSVVLYKVSKKDPNKGGFRHLAFQAEFVAIGDDWFIAIRPDWYFSTHPNFRPSPIGPDLLKGIKRLENNKSVEQHFRFLCRWLRNVGDGDLITEGTGHLSYGDIVEFDNHPGLDDSRWLPIISVEPPPESAADLADLLHQDNETTLN